MWRRGGGGCWGCWGEGRYRFRNDRPLDFDFVRQRALFRQVDTLSQRCYLSPMSIANPDYKPQAELGFDHLKSVQMVAFFVRKAGGRAEKLKLVKLLYLAERRSFQRRGKPMNFDSYFSLPHGPVVSSALNGMDHLLEDASWDALAQADNRKDITVNGEVAENRLSLADRAILEATWDEFGGMTASQIRNWTHEHCPEYVEVEPGSRLPIDLSEIMGQVGIVDADNAARELRRLQKEVGRLERARAP